MRSCIFVLALMIALASAMTTVPDVCSQPPVVGYCRAAMPRYHFNAISQTCEYFIYGGCGGNENNFVTLKECQDRCGGEPITTETPLVRCIRPVCAVFCEYGNQNDERGCPTCECQPNPCLAKVCAENEKCVLNDYEEAQCIAVIRTVEQGDSEGEESVTDEVAPTPPCPLVMCLMYCEFDFTKDPETGCAKCACNESPCKDNVCGEGELCKPEKISDVWTAKCVANLTQVIKQVQPMTPIEPAISCPILRCMTSCDFGFMTDENGCGTCECKMHPCDGAECGEGQVCKPLEVQCFDLPCPMVPNCVLEPLCLRQREDVLGDSAPANNGHLLGEDSWSRPPQDGPASGLLGGDSWSRPPTGDAPAPEIPATEHRPMLGEDSWSRPPQPWAPECTENGDFNPRQCNRLLSTCWCVDDRGVEIDGSRRNITPGTIPPVCAFNQTTALHGKFQMSHDIDDIDNHLDNIQELTHQSLSEWMLIEREYITIVEIRPYGADVHVLEVDFYVRADQLGYHDLATSSYHLQDKAQQGQLQMDYGDHTLKPNPDSLHIDHEFSPVLPSTGLRADPKVVECEFYENHKTAIFAGLLGLVFFVLVLVVLLKMVIAKKRLNRSLTLTQPGDKYRENLAFSNQLYGKVTDEEKVVLPNVEFTANSEAIA